MRNYPYWIEIRGQMFRNTTTKQTTSNNTNEHVNLRNRNYHLNTYPLNPNSHIYNTPFGSRRVSLQQHKSKPCKTKHLTIFNLFIYVNFFSHKLPCCGDGLPSHGANQSSPTLAWSIALAGPLHRKMPSINSSSVTCSAAVVTLNRTKNPAMENETIQVFCLFRVKLNSFLAKHVHVSQYIYLSKYVSLYTYQESLGPGFQRFKTLNNQSLHLSIVHILSKNMNMSVHSPLVLPCLPCHF